jgi:hypothetical protein
MVYLNILEKSYSFDLLNPTEFSEIGKCAF